MKTLASRRRLIDFKQLSDHEKKNLTILETVRRKAPISRAEISRLTDFNIVTVTSYVDQYLKKGLLKEVGMDVSSGGRKPALVDLEKDKTTAIGIGLNAAKLIGILCNIKGEVVHRIERDRSGGEHIIEDMLGLVESLIEASHIPTDRIHGVGIGLPGIIDRESNTVRWPTGLGTRDLSFSIAVNEKFQKRLHLPVLVDNDANAAVYGEQWAQDSLQLENAIYLYSGAGCGFLLEGQIYRGNTGSAGEWLFDMEQEHPEEWVRQAMRAGDWALDLGMARRAREEIKNHPLSLLYKETGGIPEKIDFKLLVKCAASADDFVLGLFRQAGRALGRKAALLVNLLNPGMIIIGGGLEQCGLVFVDAVSQEIRKCSVPEAIGKLKVVPSQLGDNAVSLGAAALVVQNFFVEG